jgi:hypothetical protein
MHLSSKDIIDARYTASHESLVLKIYLSLLLKVNRVYLKISIYIYSFDSKVNLIMIIGQLSILSKSIKC